MLAWWDRTVYAYLVFSAYLTITKAWISPARHQRVKAFKPSTIRAGNAVVVAAIGHLPRGSFAYCAVAKARVPRKEMT
jgi:hypothetical protein